MKLTYFDKMIKVRNTWEKLRQCEKIGNVWEIWEIFWGKIGKNGKILGKFGKNQIY